LQPFIMSGPELLVEPVRGVYEWEWRLTLLKRAEGRPHRLQQIALEAVNHMLAASRLRITLEDVKRRCYHRARAHGTIGVILKSV
jgi:hypothetical protein